jgi:hypothetical protein
VKDITQNHNAAPRKERKQLDINGKAIPFRDRPLGYTRFLEKMGWFYKKRM